MTGTPESDPMEPRQASLRVLADEGKALHWTVILDLAQRRGYLDPFTQPDLRRRLLASLAEAARAGEVDRREKGVYALPGGLAD
jgi:hypothetical protein